MSKQTKIVDEFEDGALVTVFKIDDAYFLQIVSNSLRQVRYNRPSPEEEERYIKDFDLYVDYKDAH